MQLEKYVVQLSNLIQQIDNDADLIVNSGAQQEGTPLEKLESIESRVAELLKVKELVIILQKTIQSLIDIKS